MTGVTHNVVLQRGAIPVRAGIGLRAQHHEDLLRQHPAIGSGSKLIARYFADAERPADLPITNLVIPRLDGLELARRLRSQSEDRPRLLAISASASGRTTDEAFQAGCAAFVPKPLRLSDLLDTVGSVVSFEWRYDTPANATPQALAFRALCFTPSRAHAKEL